MNLKDILLSNFNKFFKWRKAKLIKALINLRDKYLQSQTRVKQLEKENAQLKEQLEKDKIKATNKEVNKPSSKQAEWEKDGSKKQGKEKKRNGGVNKKLAKVQETVQRIKSQTSQKPPRLKNVTCAEKI